MLDPGFVLLGNTNKTHSRTLEGNRESITSGQGRLQWFRRQPRRPTGISFFAERSAGGGYKQDQKKRRGTGKEYGGRRIRGGGRLLLGAEQSISIRQGKNGQLVIGNTYKVRN